MGENEKRHEWSDPASARTDPLWGPISLTLAVAFLGLLVTISGVLVATCSWRWRLAYGGFWGFVVVVLFWSRRIRNAVIRFIKDRVPALPKR